MENTETLLNEIKQKTGVKDLSNLSEEDAKKILESIADKRINKKQLEALIKTYPNFIEAEIEALKSIQKIVESAEKSQTEVLRTISKSIEGINKILEKLADKVQNDESRIKIAELTIEVSKLYVEFAKINKDINQENNSFYLKISSIVGGILLMAAMILLGIFGNFGSGKSPDNNNK